MVTTSRRTLPVEREKTRICEKIYLNRVLLIIGGTGCGKSSQIPQMLLEELGGPILCTQPRRLAVVAVAKRVAQERGCKLGGDEVGYRIGQRPHFTSSTRIVFATAGVLLEELRGRGPRALQPYKCVVLDEVHERSVESDLVLTCLREFMREHRTLRLVLMSATADVERYERYFREILEGHLDRITIPDFALTLRHVLLTTTVKYLDEAVRVVRDAGTGNYDTMLQLYNTYRTCPEQVDCRVGPPELSLVRDLVAALHQRDPDLSHTVMAFLPTYKTLETVHELLLATGLPLAIYALHSSIDVDECVASMEAAHPSKRKCILATNIAESSVTIEGVYYVLDACRTLQISWDRDAQSSRACIVWASKSQCDQRKGRTGRTCDGVVYRLVPRALYESMLPKFEAPAVTLQPLRREVLCLLCSESALTNHPPRLLARCMDLPDEEVVLDALEHLKEIGAAEAKGKSGLQPTPYGRFLGGLPVSLEAAQLVAAGGKAGLLRPAAVLAAILNVTPFPIHRPFASYEAYMQNLRRYGCTSPNGADATAVLLANLAAFNFWQHAFHDPRRWERLVSLGEGSAALAASAVLAAPAAGEEQRDGGGAGSTAGEGPPEQRQWCGRHSLIYSSLNSVAELVLVILGVVHKHRPDFLDANTGPPHYLATSLPPHKCARGRADSSAAMQADGDGPYCGGAGDNCSAPFMQLASLFPSQHIHTLRQLLSLRDVPPSALLDISTRDKSGSGSGGGGDMSRASSASSTSTLASAYSLEGSVLGVGSRAGSGAEARAGGSSKQSLVWSRGSSSSSGGRLQAAAGVGAPQQPLCRFFGRGQGCSRGAACRFRHESPATVAANSQLDASLAALMLRAPSFGWADVAPAPHGRLGMGSARATAGQPSSAAAASAAAGAAVAPGLLRFGSGHSVLVLGDGDLSFTEALAAQAPAARLMSSVHLSLSQLVGRYAAAEGRLGRLAAAGVPVLLEMDARELHTFGTSCNQAQPWLPRLRRDSAALASCLWPPPRATHILWNFPFNGRDEDDEGNKLLLAQFLAAAGAAMVQGGFRAQVLLTLCNDQFSRWAVEASAREAFFFVTSSAPFDPSSFPGYAPKRGHADDPFPFERALTFALDLHLPRALAGRG